MHFDTTGCETDEYKAVKEKADEIKALGGVDFETYSAKAADGWTLTEMNEKHSDAEFSLDAVQMMGTSTCTPPPKTRWVKLSSPRTTWVAARLTKSKSMA